MFPSYVSKLTINYFFARTAKIYSDFPEISGNNFSLNSEIVEFSRNKSEISIENVTKRNGQKSDIPFGPIFIRFQFIFLI